MLKYVFVARPASKTASTKHPKQAELEDGWVLVVEDIGNEKQDSDGIKVVNASDYHLGDEEEAKVCSFTFLNHYAISLFARCGYNVIVG